MQRTITYGMVGGDLKAFIGKVHRGAIALESLAVLTAGCFSTHADKNQATAAEYSLAPDRVYADYRTMAETEGKRTAPIDFVIIVTPNVTHYEIAKTFLENGIHVVCEKPLCWTVEQAVDLRRLADAANLQFMVTYAYSGFAMVKHARQLVAEGKLGKIIDVNAEYPQEWLIDELDKSVSKTAKFSGWRADPKVSGLSNCVGDIGSHAAHTAGYITGLQIRRVAARVDYFDHDLDLNANMLLEYENGASGVLWSSQVAIGHPNSLRVRVYGTLGSLEWIQEQPEQLIYTARGEAPQTLSRGAGYIRGRAAEVGRIPAGHVEGYFEAFATLYKTYIAALRRHQAGEIPTESELDFPGLDDGIEGVRFITAVIESGRRDAAWVEL